MIHYQVCYADWEPKGTGEMDEEGHEKFVPWVGEEDFRTCRTRRFETEMEAFDFAKEYLEKYKDADMTEWLAYLEVQKCTTETIQKLK
jgi:hypothetical protein